MNVYRILLLILEPLGFKQMKLLFNPFIILDSSLIILDSLDVIV
jgi:hypothetical protein